MKITTGAFLFLVTLGTRDAAAFQSPLQALKYRTKSSSSSKSINARQLSSYSPLCMSSDDGLSEVEKLRAAAAKAREEYERLSKEMGKEVSSSPTATATAPQPTKKSLPELQKLASSIDFESGDALSQCTSLDQFVDEGDFSCWKSAVRRMGSSMSLLQPFPVTLTTLESRTGGKVTSSSLGVVSGESEGDVKFEDFQDLTIAVVLGSTVMGILSLAVLPPNIGATFTYLFALIPVVFLGVGSTAPGIIAGAISSARGDNEDDATLRERVCRHEAGHFLCGYLCGLPVKNYQLSADDSDNFGVPSVEFHMASVSSPTATSAELTQDDVAALSVVAMSGSIAEILRYGKATGGQNDLLQLQQCFQRSKEFIGAAQQQDLTRWGALTAFNLLNSNKERYEALVEAFQQKKGLADCVAIIESS